MKHTARNQEKINTFLDILRSDKSGNGLTLKDIKSCYKKKGRKEPSKNTIFSFINELQSLGYHIETEDTNYSAKHYRLIESDDATDVSPITEDDYREYLILSFIRENPSNCYINKIYKEFLYKANDEVNYDYGYDSPSKLYISKTLIRSYLISLIETGYVKKESNHNKLRYVVTNKLPTYLWSLSNNFKSLSELADNLDNYASVPNQYQSQLKSISNKVKLIGGFAEVNTKDNPSLDSNFILFGRKYIDTEYIKKEFHKLENLDYRHKILNITYQTKSGHKNTISFILGLILYSYERNGIYLIGRNKNYTSIIPLHNILKISETNDIHSEFQNDYYLSLFENIFAPENITDSEGYKVEIKFNNIYNTEQKLNKLISYRKKASLTKTEDNKFIVYKDTIVGLYAFASYLRKHANAVEEIIEPSQLKEIMKQSCERTLNRYKEINHYETR